MNSVLVDLAEFGSESGIGSDRINRLIGLAEVVVVVEVDQIDLFPAAAAAAAVVVDRINWSVVLEVV